MATTAYIGIGSNLGEKLDNCIRAIDLMEKLPGCGVMARSDFYRTSPVGVEGQDWYVNGAVSLATDLPASSLLKGLLWIEEELGRIRRKKWDSRTIDLDILLYGQAVINEKDLIIPHPSMHLRKFTLKPMVQLAPNLVHPVLGSTMVRLLDGLSEEAGQEIYILGET